MDPGSSVMLGRYVLLEEIASGGMAKVHLAQLPGPHGFSRLVAIKCLHDQFAKEEDFVAMLFDEARLLSRVRHPNVVPILEVIDGGASGVPSLVMEYVDGTTLSKLQATLRRTGASVPIAIVSAIACDMLEGLHAAHEAKSDAGEALGIVHRDVSPQNVMLDREGIAKVLDFGVAKAEGRLTSSSHGSLKGKAGYMAPEQVRGAELDRRCDVFAAGIVVWELLVGQRFAQAENQVASMLKILESEPQAPSTLRADVPPALDAVVLRALQRRVDERFATARAMAVAIEGAMRPASRREVAAWVASVGAHELEKSAEHRDRALTKATASLAPATTTEPLETIRTVTLTPIASTARWQRPVLVVAAVAVAVAMAWNVFRARPDDPRSVKLASGSSWPDEPPAHDVAVEARASVEPLVSAPVAPASPPRATGATAPPRPKRPPSVRCDPPYTIRGDGIHVPKPECL